MSSLYERVGGEEFFEGLVARFYAGVASDPVLRPLYPDDLEPAERRLGAFLAQYFGGPRAYEELRGEPRLRMRHLRFPIDTAARDRWIAHMEVALAADEPAPEDAAALRRYFAETATFLVNRGLAIVGSS